MIFCWWLPPSQTTLSASTTKDSSHDHGTTMIRVQLEDDGGHYQISRMTLVYGTVEEYQRATTGETTKETTQNVWKLRRKTTEERPLTTPTQRRPQTPHEDNIPQRKGLRDNKFFSPGKRLRDRSTWLSVPQ
ncbi:GM25029 [Drosophila sechellia]|uniref:GM25029 n=1 Tax=Drosophila sechellia TaxID=7238 RepID=B4IMV5_DROSE|nr:GM25029 [Drosophila sechellia]